MIAKTPEVPYYAVIFTSIRTDEDDGYADASKLMVELAKKQKGFLGLETVRDRIGITVSYWDNLESIKKWKYHSEHQKIQQKGKMDWYAAFKVRICKVEKDYEFFL